MTDLIKEGIVIVDNQNFAGLIKQEAFKNRDWYFVDWSKVNGIHVVKNREVSIVSRYLSLSTFLDTLDSPSVIILEATFESYSPRRHEEFIARCGRESHIIFVTPTKLTARRRAQHGYPEKSDANDARVICKIVTIDNIHLKYAKCKDIEKIKRREAANSELMVLRREQDEFVGPKGGFNYVTHKDKWATELIACIKDFDAIDPKFKVALGNSGNDYSLTTISAVGIAARHSRDIKDFYAISGLHQNGYPCQIRADLFFWSWQKKCRGKISMDEWRKAIVWLFEQLRIPAKTLPLPKIQYTY